ncbi:formin-like protein 18 [Artemisia annua]|uniref:Formin-like protein n=1 Tax=Artemisia annua TaxID=35608 RepID=A0A2U1NPP4_ARTAN|nr:formin-like protein 18 [Artemisia annua]
MALLRKLFYKKPPDGLLEISERLYVFDCCFTTDAWEQEDYKSYMGDTVDQLKKHYPDASILIFNFGDEESSQIASALSDCDFTIMDYPRQYKGCPLLPMQVIHHFLRSSESWLSLGQQNVLLMHCERGGWPVLAYMLAALLIYRKHYTGEYKTLDMIYKQAPRELLHIFSPLDPIPSQLRYLQYVSRRNAGVEWPPSDRALTLDCLIIRMIPDFDGNGGCRPIFRIYGQDPLCPGDKTPKLLFSTPKTSKNVHYYKQAECVLVKIDINCHVQGDIVLESINLHSDLTREKMMYRAMFNTAFIRSNILMLNRDEIDVLWEAKDLFPMNFRAELLFSDMDAAASKVPVDLACIDEEGLPMEAFAKVQEMFNSVDWLDPKSDAALNVLHQIAASDIIQDILETGSPRSVHAKSLFNVSAADMNKQKVTPCMAVEKPSSPPHSPSLLSNQQSQKVADNKVKPNPPCPPPPPPTIGNANQSLFSQPMLHPRLASRKVEYTAGKLSTPTSPDSPTLGDNRGDALEPDRPPPTRHQTESQLSSSTSHSRHLKEDKIDGTNVNVTSPVPPAPPPPPAIRYVSENMNTGVVPPPPPPPATRSVNGNVKVGVVPPPPPPLSKSGNVSGGPAPPPPVPKLPALSKPVFSKNQQSNKLKALHWLKLTRAVSGSLWAEAQKSGEASNAPEIDMSELESLFPASNASAEQADAKLKSRAAIANKPEKVQLIDHRRAYNCEIMLSKVKLSLNELMDYVLALEDSGLDPDQVDNLIKFCPTQEEMETLKIDHRRAYNCEIMLSKVKLPLNELMDYVLALEDSGLDPDQVDNLIKFCPTQEEMETLKGYKGEKDKLGKCEQFFLELMKVPRTESKLRVFSFKMQFSAQVSDLMKNLNIINSVVEQASYLIPTRSSGKLKRVMQTILSLGNALNQGTARGSAVGFRLDSLLKLTEIRGKNNRMTLMHYLCKMLADKLPEVLDFSKDLSSLEPAAKIQLKYLAEEMQAISKGLEKVSEELSMAENDGPVSENFRKVLKEFLHSAEGEVRSLASLYSAVGKNVDSLILYFGEDPVRCPYEQVVSTLLKFVRMFNQANEENAKQLEAEKKKAEREASNEKLKLTHIKSQHIPQTRVKSA